MVSQFMVELLGTKAVQGEEPLLDTALQPKDPRGFQRPPHDRAQHLLPDAVGAATAVRGWPSGPNEETGPSGQMTWIRDGPMSLDSKNNTEAIDNSLLRLGVDYIDLYQIHWPDRYVPMFGETEYDPSRQYTSVPIEEQLEVLGRAIHVGKIRYIGLSNETPYGLMNFLRNSYNLLCQNFDSGLAECCHHERISLLAYSPLAMGILSGKYHTSDDGGPPDARINLSKEDTLRVNPDTTFRAPNCKQLLRRRSIQLLLRLEYLHLNGII